jgi:hypothetical protein
VLKAAVVANAKRVPETSQQFDVTDAIGSRQSYHEDVDSSGGNTCPRCTFHNAPGMSVCEICSAPLPNAIFVHRLQDSNARANSPGPEISGLSLEEDHEPQMVKFSFRAGGDRVFYDRLKNAMIQRKWLLQQAPPIPKADQTPSSTPSSGAETTGVSETRVKAAGIAGLEQRGLRTRKNNEAVLGSAFEDLEALMASAKDIVALAERFAAESGSNKELSGASSDPVLSQSAVALGMITTKDVLGDSSNTLYINELARNLAEYATDDRRGVLRHQGGTMSLVDLWAVFNKSQNGVELVSPADFHKAAEAWERLSLPIKLRRYRSGLLVVQRKDASDEKTIKQLQDWLNSLRNMQPDQAVPWDQATFGLGVTAQQAAAKFGWSLGVASEELEMAEETGALCREEGVEGLKFWLNILIEDD